VNIQACRTVLGSVHIHKKFFVKLKEWGDAWFDSVTMAVEVKKWSNVESTWIIKSNHSFYPMEALYAIMNGKFGFKATRHLVSTTTSIGII
jgi:hypothetical protein